jgi:hypothetical protein
MLVESSLATGQPFTVLSGREEGSSIPRDVIMEDGHMNRGDMQTLNGKRFNIFVVLERWMRALAPTASN